MIERPTIEDVRLARGPHIGAPDVHEQAALDKVLAWAEHCATTPTVQVPVSLIEGMPHETSCNTQDWRYGDYYGEDLDRTCDCYRAKFAALLSQPTPTAEPKMIDCPKCGLQYDHGNGTHAPWPPTAEPWYEKTPRTDEQFVADLLAKDAEPPRIEDLAPGTMFSADTIATRYGSRWTVLPSGRVESGMGIGHEASEIDPSTVRDVTPPRGSDA